MSGLETRQFSRDDNLHRRPACLSCLILSMSSCSTRPIQGCKVLLIADGPENVPLMRYASLTQTVCPLPHVAREFQLANACSPSFQQDKKRTENVHVHRQSSGESTDSSLASLTQARLHCPATEKINLCLRAGEDTDSSLSSLSPSSGTRSASQGVSFPDGHPAKGETAPAAAGGADTASTEHPSTASSALPWESTPSLAKTNRPQKAPQTWQAVIQKAAAAAAEARAGAFRTEGVDAVGTTSNMYKRSATMPGGDDGVVKSPPSVGGGRVRARITVIERGKSMGEL